jgi:hypothetical protein
MDDQNGNVIDGTERARQWRRSRSKAAAAAEPNSDAPKSIASSLLVPAELVSAITSQTAGEDSVATDENVRAAAGTADARSVAAARFSDEKHHHPNPFLAPESARIGNASKGARSPRGRSLAALISRSAGGVRTRYSAHRPTPPTLAATPRRRLRMVRLTRPVIATLGALGGVALVAAILTQLGTSVLSPAQPSRGLNTQESLPIFRPGSLAAGTNPLGARESVRQTVPHRARHARVRRATNEQLRKRYATSRAATRHRYTTPPSSASRSSTASAASNAGSSGSSGSTPPSSAPPAGQPASATGGSSSQTSTPAQRPAFGLNGTLGPGHGNGTG